MHVMQDNAKSKANKLILQILSDNKKVYLRIEDTGHGISKENLGKIFNHGFTTKENGSGFGLRSSANFLTEMDATIHAESNGKGSGTAFILSFPI